MLHATLPALRYIAITRGKMPKNQQPEYHGAVWPCKRGGNPCEFLSPRGDTRTSHWPARTLFQVITSPSAHSQVTVTRYHAAGIGQTARATAAKHGVTCHAQWSTACDAFYGTG